MRKWRVLILLCIFCMPAWAERFKFVSYLSAPVASFEVIETKDNEHPVAPFGEVNAGSIASTSGEIRLEGNPIRVTNLYMEDGTKIEMGEGHWIVRTLTIGTVADGKPEASVKVKRLQANSVYLYNSGSEESTTLNVESLTVGSGVYTSTGQATSSLTADGKEGGQFQFTSNNEPEKIAETCGDSHVICADD